MTRYMASELYWVWMWWSPASHWVTLPRPELPADGCRTCSAMAGVTPVMPTMPAVRAPVMPAARSRLRRESSAGERSRSGTDSSGTASWAVGRGVGVSVVVLVVVVVGHLVVLRREW